MTSSVTVTRRLQSSSRPARVAAAGVLVLIIAGCASAAPDAGSVEGATATDATAPLGSSSPTSAPSVSTSSTPAATSTTSTSTTVAVTTTTTVAPVELPPLYIDFYWAHTYGITALEEVITVGEDTITNPYVEITVIDGFVVPPLLRITAQDIEAVTFGIGAFGDEYLHLGLAEETCEELADILRVWADAYVFRVTVGEDTAWGWQIDFGSPWVPGIAHIHASPGCWDGLYVSLRPQSTTIGGVPLADAIANAWHQWAEG